MNRLLLVLSTLLLTAAIHFDGGSDRSITVGADAQIDNVFTTNGCVTFWYYPITDGQFNRAVIVAKQDAGSVDGWYIIFRDAIDTLNFAVLWSTSGDDMRYGAPTGITVSNWHHIAFNYHPNTNSASLYVDGELYGPPSSQPSTGTGSIDDDSDRDLVFGMRPDLLREADMYLEDVRLYRRNLTPAEISIMHAKRGRDTIFADCAGRWLLRTPASTLADGTEFPEYFGGPSGYSTNGIGIDGTIGAGLPLDY